MLGNSQTTFRIINNFNGYYLVKTYIIVLKKYYTIKKYNFVSITYIYLHFENRSVVKYIFSANNNSAKIPT